MTKLAGQIPTDNLSIEHKVHGIGLDWQEPDWPAVSADEARQLLRQFDGAGEFIALHWHAPRPLSATSLLESSNGEYFLKRHPRALRTAEALREEHRFSAHLHATGLSVPQIIGTKNGDTIFATDDWTYELQAKANGLDPYRDRQSWTPYLCRQHAWEAGKALAMLHKAAASFDAPERGPHPLVTSLTILPAADPIAAMADYVAARPAAANYLADKPWRSVMADLLAQYGERLSDDLARQPSLWTHNDWHPTNLLWTREGAVETIFDFGLSTRTNAVHDIATAIERACIPWLEYQEGYADARAEPESALSLLQGYHSILPLSAQQLDLIIRLLPLVHVEFALSELDYFAGPLAQPALADVAWYDFFIGHAAWFDSDQGRIFMQQLRDYVQELTP